MILRYKGTNVEENIDTIERVQSCGVLKKCLYKGLRE